MMMRKIVKEGIAAEIPYRWIAPERDIRKPHLKNNDNPMRAVLRLVVDFIAK